MDRILVRSDFAERREYRLVSVDESWTKHLCEQACPRLPERQGTSARPKRRRGGAPADAARADESGAVTVELVMKGDEQLCLHNAHSTRSMRRVEYSNVMLLARRRLSKIGRCAARESQWGGGAGLSADAGVSATDIRQHADSVVVASLSRMFDSHAAHPQGNVLAVLGDSYLTIEELEGGDGDVDSDGVEAGASPSQRSQHFTFAQLARTFRSSPVELAGLLQSAGAVVHRGCVRLLHPCLVHEALTASLAFLDAAEPCEASWAAVRQHLCPSIYPEVVLRSLEAVYGAQEAGTAGDDAATLVGMSALFDAPRVLVGLAGGVFDVHLDAVVTRTLSTGEVVRGLPYDTFVPAWMDAVPSCFFGVGGIPRRDAADTPTTLLEKLRGYVVIEPRAGGGGGSSGTGGGSSTAVMHGTVWWLPKESLANDFCVRLRALFELRPQRWDQADLKEYLAALLPPDQTFEHIIVRHTREYRIPGQPVQYAPLQ
ncbi:hypothetical protein NESM_000590200 [Novymonas esmeraldas]|uniref:Sister chromatid cohesion protein DCC1 n=1 Tax=Novymonas esmeraldas TaxID=1808958 RepID=A0AAW0EQT1_9TRYP